FLHLFLYGCSGCLSFYTFIRLLPSSIRPAPTSTLFPYTTLFRSPSRNCRYNQNGVLINIESNANTFKISFQRFIHSPGLIFCYRSEEHTSEFQSRPQLVCRLLFERKNEETFSYDNTAMDASAVAR